jgi:trimeric autotransporter adhesin
MAIESPAAPRSRRALLAGALGGLAAAAAAALGRPGSVRAAAGSTMIIGSEANNAGSANTQLLTNSDVVAFKLLQNGPGTALMGYATPATGATRGVYGRVDSPNGFGVQARNAGAAGTGAAVQAIGVNNHGVDATTDDGDSYAVRGVTNSGSGTAIYGYSPSGNAIVGQASGGVGVRGMSATGTGVFGHSDVSYSGFFDGSLYATSANASVKAFRIDHPLDPAGKVLAHSCVESNERLTMYAGTITTDAAGEATVELPDWFDALNRDLRYQLTVIGSFARAMIKREVAGNRFTLATSEPGTKVSWQVTGVRQDAYAKAHPLAVETAKTGPEKGRYLNPLEHGQPETAGVAYDVVREARVAAPEPSAVR